MGSSHIKRAEKTVEAMRRASDDPGAELAVTAIIDLIQILKDLEIRIRMLEQRA